MGNNAINTTQNNVSTASKIIYKYVENRLYEDRWWSLIDVFYFYTFLWVPYLPHLSIVLSNIVVYKLIYMYNIVCISSPLLVRYKPYNKMRRYVTNVYRLSQWNVTIYIYLQSWKINLVRFNSLKVQISCTSVTFLKSYKTP